MDNVRKFVTHDVSDVTHLANSSVFKLLTHFNNGGTHVDADKELITTVFSELWHPETYKSGIYKLGGYIFDFSPFLRSYLVKVTHYGWIECKAFSKSWLRSNSVRPSHIEKIVELDIDCDAVMHISNQSKLSAEAIHA